MGALLISREGLAYVFYLGASGLTLYVLLGEEGSPGDICRFSLPDGVQLGVLISHLGVIHPGIGFFQEKLLRERQLLSCCTLFSGAPRNIRSKT